jgi:hypothetical protein
MNSSSGGTFLKSFVVDACCCKNQYISFKKNGFVSFYYEAALQKNIHLKVKFS